MSRPICVHCGKPYGQRRTRDHVTTFMKGEPVPAYRGNGIVVREHEATEEHREVVVPDRPNFGMRGLEPTGVMRLRREIWDGETWSGGYHPFCKLRCALDYARKAYRRESGK